MTIDIRHLPFDESVEVLNFLTNYAFTPTPPLPKLDEFTEKVRKHEGFEFYTVFEEDRPLAVAGTPATMIQNVRGKNFRMGGIADVATHPAGRRKGYVRNLMHHIYQIFKDDGIGVSCLYPFQETFYQRLGYVTFPQAKRITFSPERLRPILKLELPGTVELLSIKDGYPIYRAYLEELQKQTHGMAIFSIPQAEAVGSRDTWLAVARQEQKVVGILQYRLKGQMMKQEMLGYDFFFSNAVGKYLLLDWIARHIDQASSVKLTLKPDQFGETLFTDLRPEIEKFFLAPMGRVINIEALQGLPVGPGKITVALEDPDCDWNNGIWRLNGEDGSLEVSQAQNPDCRLTIQGFSALVYGVQDPEEFVWRGWGDPNEEQQNVLRRMFPPALPFIHADY